MELSHSLDRWLYRGNRPHFAARIMNDGWARLAGAGCALPVVVADYEGERYLVSMLGEGSNWVHNVRAAGGRAVLRHRHEEEVQLEEVLPDERAPILRRYLECSPGARTHICVDRQSSLEDLEAVAAHLPMFRIRSQARCRAMAHGNRS